MNPLGRAVCSACVACLLVLVAIGCATASGREPVPSAPTAANQEGRASWYGPGFHGRPTASGETFDQEALTAAHPRLPFGTRVRVVNLDNGREIIVRINDRGPSTAARIIDVSRAAAQALGMIAAGTARVQIFVVQ